MKDRRLRAVRTLEELLKECPPEDCARITMELVRIKNDIMERY